MSLPPANAAARLAAIVASADDAIISKDLNGTVMTWNPGAERMFGYTAEEAIGRSIRMIIPDERQAEEDYVLSRIRQGLPVEHYETVRRRKDGSLVDISLSVSPIRDGNHVVGASKIARDITEQRRLRRMADEASRTKDEFLAVLSHELRTPLNTVLGYTRMLRTDALPGEQRDKALAILQRNAEALARLIDDVLDTSRVVTGKLRLNLEAVPLRDVIGEALDSVRPSIDAKRLVVGTDLSSTGEITGDRDRLRQVIWNLLSNAAKFTPSGGSIVVRLFDEGPDAVLEVQDSGVGITADHLPLVFQRFWQADRSVSREQGGLGIGLALARHLVELHGGEISVTSGGPGAGATFTVRLPLRHPSAQTAAPLRLAQ